MVNTNTLQPLKLTCYLVDDESKQTLKVFPFKEHGIAPEFYDGGIAYAIEHLNKERSPDIVLVDISKSSLPLSDLQALAEACEPRVEVIVIGEKNDVGLFRNLMKAGVRDYLVKPLLESLLTKSLQEITIREEIEDASNLGSINSGKIIAVMGTRGGIGVSSTVANLGVLLSETYGKRVCLIDMDMHTGTMPQYLDIETSEGFSQLFESPDRIDKVLLDRYMAFFNERLGVLCSELSFLEKPEIKLESVDSLFNFIAPQFHYTLIDLPRHFSQESISHVLSKATQLVVLCDYSMTSLKDTCRILQMARTFPNLSHGAIVVGNQLDLFKQGNIEKESYEETIQHPINVEIKFDEIYPLKALLDGDPVVIKNKGELAHGLQTLAKLIMGINIHPKKESFLSNGITNLLSHLKSK